MLKKVITFLLVVSLTAAVAIGGTLAYLTDRDSDANVFTVGDVNIDLNEEFEQGATLIPGVEIEKKPTVTNVGPNEAWVWTTVAVPANLDSVIEFGGNGAGWDSWSAGTATQIDGKDYILYTILHTDSLEDDEETDVLFETVALDETVDIDPEGNWYTVVRGAATALNWKNSDGNPVIYVSAYGIQTEGFDTVEEAYAAYHNQWGSNSNEYAPAIEIVGTADELADALAAGSNVILRADIAMDESLSAAEEVNIDLNGYTLSTVGLDLKEGGIISDGIIKSAEDTSMTPHLKISGGEVTLKNMTVDISHYLNYAAQGNRNCAEFSGVDVADATLVLEDCDLLLSNDAAYTWTYIYGISVNNGTVTMNGGSMVFDSVQAATAQYNAVVSCMGTSVVNLNGVDIQNGNCIVTMGDLTINTDVSCMNGIHAEQYSGGTYVINYNP